MKTKRIAFWTYDQYPYALFGEVMEEACKEINGKTHCATKKYGIGFWFEPFMILPESEALPIIERLGELEENYHREQHRIDKDAMTLLKEALPDHPKFKK